MEYREIYEKIKNDGLYNMLVIDYYKMTKEDLRDIAKELYYNYIYDKQVYSEEDLIEKLKEIWEI